MTEHDINSMALDYISHPDEVKTALWSYLLDVLQASEDDLIPFPEANKAVFEAAAQTGLAIERAEALVANATRQ